MATTSPRQPMQPCLSPGSDSSPVNSTGFETPVHGHGDKPIVSTPASSLNSPCADPSSGDRHDADSKTLCIDHQLMAPSSARSSIGSLPAITSSDSSPAIMQTMIDSFLDTDVPGDTALPAFPGSCTAQSEEDIQAPSVDIKACQAITADSSEPITVKNAQNIYLPEACVFVANLPKYKTDVEIERILRHRFGGFGNVFIKVRRDKTKLPIAFCQYTTVDDAERALVDGLDIKVFGRGCRVEKARCQRALYVTNNDGTFDFARDSARVRAILDPRGRPLEKMWAATPTDTSTLGIPPGLWVQFQLYGDCQDAYKDLRHRNDYRFEFVRERNQQLRINPQNFGRQPRLRDRMSGLPPHGSAVMVKNLPSMFDIPQICQMFTSFGLVVGTQIVTSGQDLQSNMRTAVVHFFGHNDAVNAVAFSSQYGIAAQDIRSGLWFSLDVALMWPPVHRAAYHQQKPWVPGSMPYQGSSMLRGPGVEPYNAIGHDQSGMPSVTPSAMPLMMPPAGFEQHGARPEIQPEMPQGFDHAAWLGATMPMFMR